MYFRTSAISDPYPTQPTKNKNVRPIPDPTQPNPTRGSTQPMDNSGMELLGKGSEPILHQSGVLEERCKIPT